MKASNDIEGEAVSCESYFQRNYPVLLQRAFHITAYDRALSEDLLHDVFLRVCTRGVDIKSMANPDSYLYIALRNAYVSHLRKLKQVNVVQLPDLEREVGPPSTGHVFSEVRSREQLIAICDYACGRKLRTISASIMILRFIHGYESAEVARLINRSRNAVDAHLARARQDLAAFFARRTRKDLSTRDSPNPTEAMDLVAELRNIVFAAFEGRCVGIHELMRSYAKPRWGLDRHVISHLVSCSKCLENANRLIGLPTLAERHPLKSTTASDSASPPMAEMSFAAAR